ncbi:TolC family protein [Nannocystis pusilla]|uniref:TolC family protein n=1 Tax=Nannocystis pusilla TaxID=889268 RepID=A0A9X3IY42_9BACT|nr:TolC family protein [Nannocystis pusilla]
MARALSLAGAALLGACFHAPAYAPERSLAVLRALEAPAEPTRSGEDRDAGDRGCSPRSTPARADGALTADEAFALAVANNPDLAVAEAEAAVAAAEVDVARQLDNPSFRLTNFRVADALAGAPQMNLGVRVPIPRPGTVRTRVAAARLAADAAESDAAAARRLLRVLVYQRFAQIAWLRADIDELTRAAALFDERRAQIGARVERAVATRVDLAVADLTHAEALEKLGRLRSELARAEAELARALGPGGPRRFHADAAELQAIARVPSREDLVARAVDARPELRASQARVAEARAGVHLARSAAWPWFNWVQVNYYVGPTATPASFGFGLALDLPLLSWNRGEVRAARARVRQREAEERAAAAHLSGELDEAIVRLQAADARVMEIEQVLLPRVEDAAREAAAALDAGAVDPLTANEIEGRRVAARRQHLAALFERRSAALLLEAAVGAPLGL